MSPPLTMSSLALNTGRSLLSSGGRTHAHLSGTAAGLVSLEGESDDRVCLNGYMPTPQTSGGLVNLLQRHHGKVIASPASLG